MTSRTFAAVMLAAALAGTTLTAQRGPAAAAANLPAEVLALSCAPKAALEVPDTPLRITGGQDSFVRQSHAPGDLVTINAGSQNGIEVGQEYYTRRLLISNREKITPATPVMVKSGTNASVMIRVENSMGPPISAAASAIRSRTDPRPPGPRCR